MKESFVESYYKIASSVTKVSEEHGWFIEATENGIAAKICLIHSELSEALEGLRHGNPASEHIPSFNCLEEEFADVIIRIMHLSDHLELKVAEAVIAKIEFNSSRPYKHGGKKI